MLLSLQVKSSYQATRKFHPLQWREGDVCSSVDLLRSQELDLGVFEHVI